MGKSKPKKTDGLETSNEGTSHTVIMSTNVEGLKSHLERLQQPRIEIIKKASLVDGRNMVVGYTKEKHAGAAIITEKCSAPVHPDLKKAFADLDEHLGRLCYQPITEHNPAHRENRELPALICPIHCTGYSISGAEDTEQITLLGSRTLPNAKSIDLKSPPQKWDNDIFEYEEIDELREAIMRCEGEVMLYLFPSPEWPNCKTEPDNQLSLFPEDTDEDDNEGDEE